MITSGRPWIQRSCNVFLKQIFACLCATHAVAGPSSSMAFFDQINAIFVVRFLLLTKVECLAGSV